MTAINICSNFDFFQAYSPPPPPIEDRPNWQILHLRTMSEIIGFAVQAIVSPVILSLIFNREYWFVTKDSKSSNAYTYMTHKVALVQ